MEKTEKTEKTKGKSRKVSKKKVQIKDQEHIQEQIQEDIPLILTAPELSDDIIEEPIDIQRIYTIHQFADKLALSHIIVFSGGQNVPREQLFTEMELAKITADQTRIIYSDFWIHPDDTIRTIKQKILATQTSISKSAEFAYEEIYIFAEITETVDLISIYQSITNNDRNPLTPAQYGQFINCFNIIDETKITIKESYSYEDIAAFVKEEPDSSISVPLGQRFSKFRDYLYPTNPYKLYDTTETRFEQSAVNSTIAFENELLLSYMGTNGINNRAIYFVLAKDICKYAFDELSIEDQHIIQLYYPLLINKGIDSLEKLDSERDSLIAKSNADITPTLINYYKSVDLLYFTQHKVSTDLLYIARGVQAFTITISPTFAIRIPLDNIFKNIHATKDRPLITYNPGLRQENIYRLYTESIANNGKKIPYLDVGTVSRLAREMGRRSKLAIFAQYEVNRPVDGSPRTVFNRRKYNEIYITIDPDSSIHIRSELNTPLPLEELEKMLSYVINPIIDEINAVLEQSGYIIKRFGSIKDRNVRISSLKYTIIMNVDKSISLKQQVPCITSVFDIINDYDPSIGLANLRFKRVDNFQEMNAQNALITEVYKKTGNPDTVIRALIENYRRTEPEAIHILSQYFAEYSQLQGRIIDNPGFPVSLGFLPTDRKKMIIIVDGIDNIEYIPVINQYIDTILRIIQYPESVSNIISEMKTVCRLIGETVIAERVDNVIYSVLPDSSEKGHKKYIQPLIFQYDEDIDDNPDSSMAIPELEPYSDIITEDYGYPSQIDEKMVPINEDEMGDETIENTGIYIDYEPEEEEEEEEEEDEPFEQDSKDSSIGSVDSFKLGGENTPPESDIVVPQPIPENARNFDNTVLMTSTGNYFLSRMKERDTDLFLTRKEGNFGAYASNCAANIHRQPVILTDAEKAEIDKTSPGSYNHAIKYGTDEQHQFWYICPRYWCMLTNSSITESEVKSGKCGKVIPKGSAKIPHGAYVYEFNSNTKEHISPDGKYIDHYPNFQSDRHPKGYGLPCCFKMTPHNGVYDGTLTKTQIEKRNQYVQKDAADIATKKTKGDKTHYIINALSFPIDAGRLGFLPLSVQLFLQSDNNAAVTKHDPSQIQPGVPCLLRYGIEQTPSKQSFVGVFADIYAYNLRKKDAKLADIIAPSIVEMRQILAASISIDNYIRLHNGSLVAIFRPKIIDIADVDITEPQYESSAFFKSLNIGVNITESSRDLMEETVASYENFLRFLQDPESVIDHTYLWDLFSTPNPKLMRKGYNLVIIDMPNNDLRDKIDILCPNISHSLNIFDPNKDTVLVLKHGTTYEPIYLYEISRDNEAIITKSFNIETSRNLPPNIFYFMELIKKVTNGRCRSLPSQPRIYEFKRNIYAIEVVQIIKDNYTIQSQISNYQGKIIGLHVSGKNNRAAVMVPCEPSAPLVGVNTKYMDEDDGVYIDYAQTVSQLSRIHALFNGRVPCLPTIKIIDDNLIVGIVTETNQFVKIDPPMENIEDGSNSLKPIYSKTDYLAADKSATISKNPDIERVTAIQNIAIESQFYSVFRTMIRNLLNRHTNRAMKRAIIDILENNGALYYQRLTKVIALLKRLSQSAVEFIDMPPELIASFDTITGCSTSVSNANRIEPKYCIRKDGSESTLTIPKKHLISGLDNERIYFARIADEFIRFRRIRIFMLQPNTYLSLTETQYQINKNEFLILQSILTSGYLDKLVQFNTNKYINQIGYQTAEPLTTQEYANTVPLEDQRKMMESGMATTGVDEGGEECIREQRDIIGNKGSYWKRIFPVTSKELVYRNSNICSFTPILNILKQKLKMPTITIQNVRSFLWKGYRDLLAHNNSFDKKIIHILKKQGKGGIMESVARDISTFEAVINSDTYYITDLDLWVLASTANLPIILFCSTGIKRLIPETDWIQLGGNIEEPLYFIRTPALIAADDAPEYSMIIPAIVKSHLKQEFIDNVDSAVREKRPEVSGIISFLENYIIKVMIRLRK